MIFVKSTEPYHTEKNVNRDRKIYVRFFSDMNEDTFTQSTVVLFNMNEQKTEDVHFKYRNQVLTIEPVTLLAPNAHYKIMITGGELGVKDIVDLQMSESFSAEFFTKEAESLKPPVIIEPIHRTIVDMPITIKLNGFKDATYIRLQLSDTHDFDRILFPINEQLLVSQSYIELSPDIKLRKGTYYLRAASIDDEHNSSGFGAITQFYTEGNIEDEIPMIPIQPGIPTTPEDEVEEPPVEETPEEVPPTEETPPEEPPADEGLNEEEPPKEELPWEDIINGELEPPDITEEEEELVLRVLGLYPKKNMVHVPIAELNTIVIRFNEDIDPSSVSKESVYVIAEKN